MIREIIDACDQPRQLVVKPFCFRVYSFPDKMILNQEVALESVWLKKAAVFYVVNEHSRFQNEMVLNGKIVRDLWLAFLECWAKFYLRFPNIVRSSQEGGFMAKYLRNLMIAHRTELQFSGSQAHNSIHWSEKYYDPLHQVFGLLTIQDVA